ncbi:quercetin dioxygenase-like cupin family protein [Paraburkholderia sp. MM5477-R1]
MRPLLAIEFEGGGVVDFRPGATHFVPRGTPHNPVADDECWIVSIEPVQTKHTGGVESSLTKTIEEQLHRSP